MIPGNAIIRSLSEEFFLDMGSPQDFPEQLANAINNLIQNDFSRLVQILYRMDVSESRLKEMLVTNSGEDAGMIIARLIIERERQKMQSREKSTRNDNIPDDEKW